LTKGNYPALEDLYKKYEPQGKFLVDRDGVPVKRYSPTTNPKDLEEDIVKLLAGNSKV